MIKSISESTPVSISLVGVLLATAFWLGTLSVKVQNNESTIHRQQLLLETLSQLSADNKRRLDHWEKRELLER